MAISSPADISGLLLWYSAQYEAANCADGASIAAWTDLSGNGHHAYSDGATYMTWHASGGPSAGAYIQANGSGYFTLPGRIIPNGGEITASVKAPDSGNDLSLWGWNTANMDWPSGSTVNEVFGFSGNSRYGYTAYPEIRSWHRYGNWHVGTDWGAYVNGATVASAASAMGFTDVNFYLGYTRVNGYTARNIRYGAVLLYDRKLTATERADVDAWLAANPSGGSHAYIAVPARVIASVGGVGTYSGVPANFIDGDTSTYWWSSGGQGAGQYVQVDLGAVLTVGNFQVVQGSSTDYAQSAEWSWSTDAVTWSTSPASGSLSGSVFTHTYTGPSVTARYLRMQLTGAASSWWKVNEFTWTVDSSGGGTSGPTVQWWDGTAVQPATLEGWWDGSAVQPATLEGWWDGASVQSLA